MLNILYSVKNTYKLLNLTILHNCRLPFHGINRKPQQQLRFVRERGCHVRAQEGVVVIATEPRCRRIQRDGFGVPRREPLRAAVHGDQHQHLPRVQRKEQEKHPRHPEVGNSVEV